MSTITKNFTYLLFVFCFTITSYAQCVSTITSIMNFDDLAVDATGNIYITTNYTIRKITPAGLITTIADFSGIADLYGGGIAIDLSGNIFVSTQSKILKITPTGLVTTFVEQQQNLLLPSDIAIDPSGNLYVIDLNRIVKISPNGIVINVAGGFNQSGYVEGYNPQFNNPRAITVDSSGKIFVADTGNHRIRSLTMNETPFAYSVSQLIAGNGLPGYVNNSWEYGQFNNPTGIAVDESGNLYIADSGNVRIRKIQCNGGPDCFGGNVTSFAGSGVPNSDSGITAADDGYNTNANFGSLRALTVDAAGNLYVRNSIGDFGAIRKIEPLAAWFWYDTGSYCTSVSAPQPVTLYGRGIYLGGTFTSTVGLTINSSTGAITPSTSTPGTYTITYTTPVSGNCQITTTSQVTIHAPNTITPTFYQIPPVCQGENLVLSTTSSNGISGSWSPAANNNATTTYTFTPSPNQCALSTTMTVSVLSTPTASISADGTIATSTTITNGSAVQLQLNGTLNAQPNIQWTPATAISSTTVANPVVYPSATTTYTASFVNNNGCTQTTSFTVNVTPQPNIGNLSISSSTTSVGLFDTITVDVQLTSATNLYSLYMKLKGNAAVSQYLDYSGYTAGTLLGTNVISTAPTVINGVPDFGMTKVGAVPGYSGSGLFYSFRFVPKNNVVIPAGTTFCFYLDDVSSYNASGIPCGLTNQGQYCYTFTNQVAVWPGDLNKSNTVTTADILPIGYFYNSTGAARANATIQWNAQPATLWGYNRTSTNSDAYKVFADSNGDGVINNADQAAIGFNMNQVHNRMAWQAPDHFSAQAQQTLAVGSLTVTPNSTIINGAALPQSVTFTVSVNNTGGLNALYGMSVNLGFDNTVFDLSTATVDYTGSIFGNAGSDCLALNYNSDNTVSVGLTRFGNAPINGQGLLFKVTIQTKTTLPNLTQTPVTAYVDAANNQAGDTLVIQDAPATNFTIINNLGLDTIKQDEFVLYPNPVNDILMIKSSTIIHKISVYNTLGQLLISKNENSNEFSVDLSSLSNGNYFIRLESNNKNELFKIVKM
ncbi:MAG: T9SS type A sorting domain-containing protein [Flavobacterium sp.]|nr:T9SS type A sorting domain-containing protein [Flavobacterium sp.]